ncbi:MAG: multicopper oxidase domain-containing protein [Solirubrobacterales bacterium]|nr:multicopper oxidase domain-containing protein [Solirubrobacterales bacterium]MCB8915997.1 multicopper oxidase domain-containing protein [Thermoleophilales bacterium]
MDRPADLEKLEAGIEIPPKVAAARSNPGLTKAAAVTGERKEYWIAAEPRKWNIIPANKNGKKRDQMMSQTIKKGKTTFEAWAYRQYTANFGQPMGPATVPGPLLEAEVGQTLVVHFRNKCSSPVTMHPHGAFYSNEMDGAYKGYWTDPGGFVQSNRDFTYIWECPEGTQGSWIYHDHGPLDPLPLYKGLFGSLIIRDPNVPKPDKEFFVGFHSFLPPATRLRSGFDCINGKSFTGNTPTFRANVGDDVAFHVFALDDSFHTFHLHGHRWREPDGTIIDNKVLGPGDSFEVRFTEDNPGRWLYHCHVFSHLHNGMSGWYIVE